MRHSKIAKAGETNGFTEDARKPAPRMASLLEGLAGGSREDILREHQERCIRAIERGDTYGFPPMMVADCRKIIEERKQ